MFELKYKITDADMKAVNKSIMWMYFIPYVVVSLLGIGAGIAAIVLNIRTDIFVLGIVLTVLGAILLVCTILLAIAPKNFVASALATSDDVERTVKIGDDQIVIETPDHENIELSYGEITKLKNKKSYLLAYIGRDIVMIIKDAVVSGGTLEDAYNFISAKMQNTAPAASAPAPAEDKSEEVKEQAPAEDNAEEVKEDAPVEDKAEEAKEDAPVEDKAEEAKEDAPVEDKAEDVKEDAPVEDNAEEAKEQAATEDKAEEEPAEKKAPAKKSTAKSTAAKKTTAKSSAAKSSSVKSSTAKKPAANKKPSAK